MQLDIHYFEKFFKLKKNIILNLHPQFSSMSYDIIDGEKKVKLINKIIESIFVSQNFRVIKKNSLDVWNKGWGEIYDKIKNKKFDENSIVPQYFSLHKVLRFQNEYIKTHKYFAYHMDQLIRKLVLYKFVNRNSNIIELGSGTGNNQILINKLFPKVKQTASDWSSSSLSINRLISKKIKKDIKIVKLNMINLKGWENLEINKNSLLLTTHSLEQLSDYSSNLLQKILDSNFKRVINIEPIIENYDHDNLLDFLAISYHKKRNYLINWLSNLQKLERKKEIKFIFNKRFKFGDKFHEAYSVIVWEKL